MLFTNEQFTALKDAMTAESDYRLFKSDDSRELAQRIWTRAWELLVKKTETTSEFPRAKQQRVGTMKEFGDLINAAFNPGDYRIVSRGLLEHCFGTLESIQHGYQYGGQTVNDIRFAITQLKASLAIEKKELKASSPHVQVNKQPTIWTCNFCNASSQNSEVEIPHKWTCPSK